ncbi:hypothetical protein GCK72_018571 [Caenorhabditis remanei]|uniref:Uncharacterized protein n=1 Tax=Caenorhabditis remanei TaxID=31234 RepID=A0A6A5GA58_CAERE|nr:hypothetical protein GCK72_018571 [Caenorhabditis remanei]KAF1752017.1 hypothetical protein GCK72_018571 [Caenorhabditis remanei]
MFSSYSVIFLFFSLFSVVATTGHLRLELTASNDFSLQLKTNASFQVLLLNMGSTRIVSFHPKIHQETIEITFSKRRSAPQTQIYQMRTSDVANYQTFVFSDTVLLVQSFFECDNGFVGEYCLEKSTTPSSNTSNTSKSTLQHVAVIHPSTTNSAVNINNFICGTLVIITVIFLVLIVIIYFSLRSGQQNVYIRPQTSSLTKTKCQINLEDSRCQSPESVRYSAAPTNSITITL